MPVVLNDQTYYRTADVCRMVGISRNTLFRWLKEGMVTDVEYRDWRGWRLLTLAQVETIRIKTNNITAIRQNS
jgi:predicted site-specific integrase-resolvase